MDSEILKSWKGETCVLATMHQKEQIIAPLLKEAFGIEVVVPANFDTDRFGTFTRDIKRTGNQVETARKKALAAIEQSGLSLGIASEGSFGTHPIIPLIPQNIELVVLIDKTRQLEIVGRYQSHNIRVHGKMVSSPEEALTTAISWGFPTQGVILRLSAESNRHIYKELRTEEELLKISSRLLSRFFTNSFWIEMDVRAHRCPSRMDTIKLATIDLIKNCNSACSNCTAPGFVITNVIRGLTCSACNVATDLVKETVYSCQLCHYNEKRTVENKYANQKDCPRCNP